MRNLLKYSLMLSAVLAPALANAQADFFTPAGLAAQVEKTKTPGVYFVDYGGRQVFYDCTTRLPRLAIAKVKKGISHLNANSEKIYYEREIPPECQPSTSLVNGIALAPMSNESGRVTHAREKLIPSEVAVTTTAETDESDIVGLSVTNFFPAIRSLKFGPWSKYKKYLQCVRAQTDFTLISGLINSDDFYDDHAWFKSQYGFTTPGFIYSVIVFNNGMSQAFVFSNQQTAGGVMNDRLTYYIMPISKLETIAGAKLPLRSNVNKDFVNYSLYTKESLLQCQGL